MKYMVFNYDNYRVDEVFGLIPSLPAPKEDYAFKEEWVTLNRPLFGERAVFGIGYYKKNKTTGDFEPTLFFARLDDQLEVRPEGGPRRLDPRLAIR